VDEAEVALVEVGERELVVARPGCQESAVQLRAARLPAVAGIRVATALVLRAARAERREVARGHLLAERVRIALGLIRVRVAQPAEVVVERPVLHHQDDEVVDRDVPRRGQRVAEPVGLSLLGEDRGGR
jgi:hypothetical protein